MKTTSLIVLFALLCLLRAAADEDEFPPAPAPAADPVGSRKKFGARDVEVLLLDGSTLRGELTEPQKIEIKTSFGALLFPISDVVRLRRGTHKGGDAAKISAAIKDLAGDDAHKRGEAEQLLEAIGIAALGSLSTARANAAADVRGRIDALMKKIAAAADSERDARDSLKSLKFEARGYLQLESVGLKSKLGDLKIKFDDIDSIRWLSRGNTRNMDLNSAEALAQWVDTGIDLTQGENISTTVLGTIQLFGNNDPVTPAGARNWNTRPFNIGAVVGKIGDKGDPFLVGALKRWNAESGGRLFLKIFCPPEILQNNGENSTGQFNARISTGAWADEVGR